jgi:RNA polymerase sigma-70 factor (ECF subfamily)
MTEDPVSNAPKYESTSTTLIEQLKSGDDDAWSFFVFVYRPLIVKWALRFGAPEDDANDVAQEVISSVLDSLKSFDKSERTGAFRKWLKTITHRRTVDFLRKRGVIADGGTAAQDDIRQIPDLGEETSTFVPADDDRIIELQRALEYWKNKVKPHTYKAFHRVVIDSQEPQQVADDLGIDIQVVYQACSRMLSRLRQHLGDDFGKPG